MNREVEIWPKVTDRKSVKVVNETFATREDTVRHMAQNAKKILGAKTGFEEILVLPEKLYR
jgi:hypothetical protein